VVRYRELEQDTGVLRLKFGIEQDEALGAKRIERGLVSNAAEVDAWYAKKAEAEAAGDKPDMEQAVLPVVTQTALLEKWAAGSQIQEYTSPVTKTVGTATTSQRFLTFPKYLFVALVKHGADYDRTTWQLKSYKIDCEVPMGDLDLEHLRKVPGLQEGEAPFPDETDAAPAAPAAPAFDEAVVNDLVMMGFPLEACKKAVVNTGNKGAEAASEWLMMHMEDPDFAEPQPHFNSEVTTAAAGAALAVDAGSVEMLMSMGFTKAVCEKALRSTGGDVERATDWIFSHPEDDGSEDPAPAAPAETEVDDGPGRYELVGIISHLGNSMDSGHYVCHVKKDGEWAFFNDEKVVKSQIPPFNHGYMYLYRRLE